MKHDEPSTPSFRWSRIFLLLLIPVVLYFAVRFTRDKPVTYADPLEHFKYGSTGGEREAGIPLAVWNLLPDLFAKQLPGKGYASLGFIYETNRALPIGVSQRNVQGVDRVFLNCAVCHVGTIRDTPESQRRIIVGMPANGMNLQMFERFLFACSRDENFHGGRIADELAQRKSDDFINRTLYRYLAIDLARQRLITLAQRFSFMDREPDTGPGRVDTFNPPKVLLNFPMDKLPPEEWVGNCDLPSIWNQAKREGMWLHWDGNNNSVEERNRSAAFGTGATPTTLDRKSLQRMKDFTMTNTPPRWLYGIDYAKSGRGEKLYADYCARCHGKDGKDFTGELVGKVTPIEKIKTDRRRLDSYSEELCANQGLLYADYPDERFKHFRKTFGYANQPLDGLWLRGPYLHNGSVPTLRELLEPASKRRVEFYRGYDVIDHDRVGFISDVAEEKGRKYFKFDTRLPGNGNQGHEGEEYGTNLSPEDKDALVEHLKTF
ncbi:MAG: cytochrome c [Verrucomicrobiota bacterium]